MKLFGIHPGRAPRASAAPSSWLARRSTLGLESSFDDRLRSEQFAFSLLEVMIAMGIFFVAIFGILELTSQNLAGARRLQRNEVDISVLAAQLSLTNRLEEGFDSGDFGDVFPGVLWSRTITEVSSNGLFRVDFTVHEPTHNRNAPLLERHLSVLLYRPLSGGSRFGPRR